MGARLLADSELSPCEAYSAADAVFIGEAGSPVRRTVTLPDGQVAAHAILSPVAVERAFRGVSTPVVFLMPAGIETYLTPGERYLVYGRHYADPDTFMSAEAYGTKLVDHAIQDLEFLGGIAANAPGGTISGVLELDESDSAHIGRDVEPLPNITVWLSAKDLKVSTRTAAGGYFQMPGLPSGIYTADAELPEDLVMTANPPTITRVRSGGCATLRLQAVPNGHIRGVIRREDGAPTGLRGVVLLPGDLKSGELDHYSQSVLPDSEGRFAFDGVRPGTYLLGYPSVNEDGVRLPAVYYPGTLDRSAATVIVIGRNGTQDVGEFRIPRLD